MEKTAECLSQYHDQRHDPSTVDDRTFCISFQKMIFESPSSSSSFDKLHLCKGDSLNFASSYFGQDIKHIGKNTIIQKMQVEFLNVNSWHVSGSFRMMFFSVLFLQVNRVFSLGGKSHCCDHHINENKASRKSPTSTCLIARMCYLQTVTANTGVRRRLLNNLDST